MMIDVISGVVIDDDCPALTLAPGDGCPLGNTV